MEKRAKEFLDISAKYYEHNRDKWQRLLNALGLCFDDDIYNDTIIRVYDKMMSEEDLDNTEDEVIAYWFQSFVNNIKRDKKYSRNAKRDDCDVIDLLKDKAIIVDNSHLYYPTIRMLLEKIKREYKDNDYHLFKMYYLSDYTFDDMKELVGYDVKSKIMRMKKWLRDNV